VKVIVAHNRYSSTQPSGENTVVDAEIAALGTAGVEVVPFLRDSDDIPGLPATGRALLPLAPVWAPGAQRDLARLIAGTRPDLIHLHNPYPLISPWLVRTARAHRVPVAQTVHNYRHACVAGTFFRDGRPCHDCLGRAVPLPAIRHRCYRGSAAQSAVMAAGQVAHRSTWRLVDRYLLLSAAMGEHLRVLGVTPEQLVVKPNAVPDPGEPGAAGTGFTFAGRLVPEKGVALLLAAWSRHPDGALGPLRVVGDGPLREAVRDLAAGRTDVRYLGHLDHAGVQAAMRDAAVVVAPALWAEPFGLTAVEAMANARPVLVTDRGGPPELVGDAGWVVEPSVAALAQVLPRAVREAAALGATARKRYLRRYTPAAVTAELVRIYRDILDTTGAVRR